jgi:hypothetical protein
VYNRKKGKKKKKKNFQVQPFRDEGEIKFSFATSDQLISGFVPRRAFPGALYFFFVMDAEEVYERLRWCLPESEVRTYLAALCLLRAAPRLSMHQRRIYSALFQLAYVIDPERPLVPRQRLDFSLFTPEKWRSYFRFARCDVPRLRQLLGIDNVFVTEDSHRMLGDEALLLLLRRMSSPQRHTDIEDEFGISSSTSSAISLALVRSLHDRWRAHLYCARTRFSAERLAQCAQAVSNKVYLLTGIPWPAEVSWSIVAFLDGTFHETCKPSDQYPGQDMQASAYNGYEKAHGFRYHHLLFPDGIIGHVSPLIPGRHNDATLWHKSLCA